MTFFTYVGTLTSPGSTGNQIISDPGFQPKAVLFFDGGGTGALLRMSQTAGATGNATNQAYQNTNVSTGVATATVRRETEAINHWTLGTATLQKTATLASFNATGFTLNWSLAVAGASINYLAIGGTDVLVAGGTISQTSTGNRVVTGLGFSPKMVLFLNSVNASSAGMGLGAATGSTARWVNARNTGHSFTMATANIVARLQDTTRCVNCISNAGATNALADFMSMDADGFTINWTSANPKVPTIAAWVAFGGDATFSVGTFAKAANTTQTSITVDAGLPVAPQAYLITSEASTVNTALTDGWRSSVGVTDGTRSRAVAMENKALVLPTQAFSVSDATAVLRQRAAPVSATVAGANEVTMTHNAFTSTGFTVNLTTNTIATAYVYPYVTFGPSAAAPGYKDITGSAAGVASVTTTLVRKRALAASASGLTAATGTISKTSPVVYKDLVASGVGTASTVATPTRRRRLVAAATGVGATTALLARRRSLSASATGVASVTVTLVRTRALAASATGLAAASGTISKLGAVVYKDLTGAAVASSSSTATLTRRRALVAASAAVATTTALLTRRKALSAASVGAAVTTATPTRRRALAAATAVGSSTASGTTTGRRALTAATTGTATTFGSVDKAGSLFRPLFGTSVGRATNVGTITRRRALVVASVGRATTIAAPSRRRLLGAAAAVGQATIIAFPTRRRALAASSVGASSASGSISKAGTLPTTSVIWAGDHFETGTVGTLVGWNGAIQQFDTSSAQVVWEDDRFEVAA